MAALARSVARSELCFAMFLKVKRGASWPPCATGSVASRMLPISSVVAQRTLSTVCLHTFAPCFFFLFFFLFFSSFVFL
jgi:hypothetical protein